MPFGFGIGLVSTDQIADGAVTNAKVNAAAAIASTKVVGDPAAHAAAAAPHTGHNILRIIAWNGNNTVNQAVAHTLGRTCIGAVIFHQGAGYMMGISTPGYIQATSGAAPLAVTAPDGTNIYVGNATSYPNSANSTGDTYTAIVWG